MRRALVTPLLVALVGLVGCGKAELPGEPVDDSPTAQFLEALADDPGSAADRVVPGSPAARYVRFQTDLATAREEAGAELVDVFVRRSTDGYLLCEEGDPPSCAEVTDVRLEGVRVRGFKVERTPISERVVVGSGKGSVRLLSAYEQPTTRRLWIVLQAAGRVDLTGASYGSGDKGLQVLPATDATEGVLVLTVPGGRLGDTLQLDVGGEPVDVVVGR